LVNNLGVLYYKVFKNLNKCFWCW